VTKVRGSRFEKSLKNTLDTLYETRSTAHLANDPLSFCHRFHTPEDQEIAGLIASSFAYGNVKIILRNLEQIFSVIGQSPREFTENFDPHKGLRLFAGFKHRFNDSRDLCALLLAIRTMIEEADSIENFFLAGFNPLEPDLTRALQEFSSAILSFNYTPVFGQPTPLKDSYFSFLFPSPASGSACKRLCMYLRWMIRSADSIDLGAWKSIPPAKLVIPVDTHIQRICRLLGLTSRKQADWKMACEITAALKKLSPDDPVKYDFSLCHLGISEGCTGSGAHRCGECVLSWHCNSTVTGTNS
jgi:uncharacterized protein (TIGR02757 family)